LFKNLSLEHQNNLKSIIWMVLWALAFSIAMSITKLLSTNMNTLIIVWVRLTLGLILFLPFVLKHPIKELKTRRFPLHFIRVVFMCCSMLCTYYAYSHLPLAFATSIGFTSPLITTLLAIVILHERVKWQVWLVILAGYVGVIVMVHPGNAEFNPTVAIALLANLFASCSLITVKKLSDTESAAQIMFYANVMSVMFLGIFALAFWMTPNRHDMFLLTLLGALGVLSQFCSVKALKLGKPSILAPVEYSRLVFAIPLGLLLFDEVPTTKALIGSIIIILSTGYLTFLEIKRNKNSLDQP
jgi:drug/metabolite transporter (DMT)-like permease